MNLNKSQWSVKADGMPQPIPPSAFANPTPTPKPTKTPTPKKSRTPGGLSIPKESKYNPGGSGNSAMVGGFLGGGGGPFGML